MEPFNDKYYILEMIMEVVGRGEGGGAGVESAQTDTVSWIITTVGRKHPSRI